MKSEQKWGVGDPSMVIISRYAWSISAKMLLLEHLGMPYRRGHESTSNDKNSLPEGEGAAKGLQRGFSLG